MEIDIKHACSFTGHRPERLEMSEDKVIAWLEEQIRKAVDDGYTDFISGMQRGVDIWAAEIVLKLRLDGKKIHLISACAWNGMERDWEPEWRTRYTKILMGSDKKVYVSTKPGRAAFFERNHWMVVNSSRLIGVYTGAPGGTKETVWYAKNKGLEVITILDDIATSLEHDLDGKFPNHSPFRCVKILTKASVLVINVLDSTYQGYTCEFSTNTEYDKVLADFIDIFDETYQYDDI